MINLTKLCRQHYLLRWKVESNKPLDHLAHLATIFYTSPLSLEPINV